MTPGAGATTALVDVISAQHNSSAVAYLLAFFERKRGMSISGFLVVIEDVSTGRRYYAEGCPGANEAARVWRDVSGFAVTVSECCRAADEARRLWSVRPHLERRT